MATGAFHTLVLTSSGQLYAFGYNREGQLGNSTNVETEKPNPTPTLVSLPGEVGPVTQIAAGAYHSLALTSSGQLYAFGDNETGQLGNATNNETSKPNPTPTLVSLPGEIGPITLIAAGESHSLAVTSSGQLYAFGYNRYGQLGNATNIGTPKPNPTPALVSLPGEVGVPTQIAAGAVHSLVITSSGQLYAFGFNFYGELGTTANVETSNANPTPSLVSLPGAMGAPTRSPPAQATASWSLQAVSCTAFGRNSYGQLGIATNSETNNANPTPSLVSLPGAVGTPTQIAAGENHSLAVTSGGQLYAFGEKPQRPARQCRQQRNGQSDLHTDARRADARDDDRYRCQRLQCPTLAGDRLGSCDHVEHAAGRAARHSVCRCARARRGAPRPHVVAGGLPAGLAVDA